MKKLLKRLSSSSRENLHKDAEFKCSEGFESYGDIGYEVKEKELSKLCKAIWNGDLLAVERYVMKDQMLPDKESRTPLHLACVKGDDKIVQCLLEYNAKVNIVDQNNQTPLMKAIEGGHLECVKLLLNYRADLTVRDKYGNAPIHQAVKFGRKDIIELFLRNGVSINTHNQLLHSLRDSVGRVPSTKDSRLEARPDFKRPSNRKRLFGNENTVSDSGSGDEDTGDDILEGFFESSDEESKDRGGTLSSVARGTHSSDEAVLKRANCLILYPLTTTIKTTKCCDTSAVSLVLLQTASLQDGSWNSNSSEAKSEGGRKKVNLAAALSAKLAKQARDCLISNTETLLQQKTETEVVVSPSPNRPVEDTESWVDDVSTHRKVGSPTDKPRLPHVNSASEVVKKIENDERRESDSPWDSTENEEDDKSQEAFCIYPPVPQVGNVKPQKSSPWDSEAEDNEVREANEVSVSTLTQVSESSDKDLSIMEEFSKVPVPLGIDHPLAEAVNRAVTSNTYLVNRLIA
ncbi:Ankyrin repeat domain-containing protein 7 [Echinococcus granulosus]|uniref:Ankyrin repeat domain-containing protein 7 n=1 Tax=Echinococcus granulosus TaxID=6210 RepID=W6UCX4_ECHGR|nr:Ankyrin repeat domain-containing protein 7 [Echinococcus granulosus]EUB59155.1 Ankyrin repeat domain-containing protein 7 [Echinococcus granulosus]